MVERETKETKGNRNDNSKRRIRNIDTCLLVVQLPQGTAFLLSSRLDSAVKRCSSEVYSPAERLGKGSGPKRLVKC